MRIGLIGVGHIGGALAHSLLMTTPFALSLCDLNVDQVQGKVLDLSHGAMAANHPWPRLKVVASPGELLDCDIIVITAGKPRGPGMSRQDLLHMNGAIISHIAQELRGFSGVVVVVTNPVDIMTHVVLTRSQLQRHQVMGMAGVLDSARLRWTVAEHLGTVPGQIQASVVGPHNDDMIPVRSSVTWGGQPVPETKLSTHDWQHIVQKTRTAGAEIVKYLVNGSAFYGPAEAIKTMILAIAWDQNQLLTCSVQLQGEYGLEGLCVGVPVIVGRQGLVECRQWSFNRQEQLQWNQGIQGLQQLLQG